jgi:hypothetical protein
MEPKAVVAEAPIPLQEPVVVRQTTEHIDETPAVPEASTAPVRPMLDDDTPKTAWAPTVSRAPEHRSQRDDRSRNDTRRERDTAHAPKRHESRQRLERSPERVAERPTAKPSNDLKSALAAALAGVTNTPVAQGVEIRTAPDTPSASAVPASREVKPQHVVISLEDKQPTATPSVPMGHVDTARIRAHLEERAEAIAHPAKAPHEITPQALAHMMRITLKDKKKRPTA